jgi:hypothetical protein
VICSFSSLLQNVFFSADGVGIDNCMLIEKLRAADDGFLENVGFYESSKNWVKN